MANDELSTLIRHVLHEIYHFVYWWIVRIGQTGDIKKMLKRYFCRQAHINGFIIKGFVLNIFKGYEGIFCLFRMRNLYFDWWKVMRNWWNYYELMKSGRQITLFRKLQNSCHEFFLIFIILYEDTFLFFKSLNNGV